MTEQMKYIVKEINTTLGRNYDLIKFDSLNEKQLLQLLVDLLVNFNAGDKLDINEDDTETVSVSLLEMLGSVKYRPPAGVEPSKFRAQLLAGDARTIHHVLHWILTNKEQVKNTAYLANSAPNNISQYKHKIMFQKCLYFNRFLYMVWIFVIGFILTEKVYTVDFLGELTIYLSVTVFALLVILEGFRIFIGQIATARNRVPEMGGFLLITNFMQLPLISFFLFNPYLRNLPIEIILNGSLWILAIMETVYGYIELKQASAIASNVYYSQFKESTCHDLGDKRKSNS